MAIKERKQVSGTTDQIKSYAGHEGQIVWNKDKKTFVGMSGTAGTNYPLATQEYADNKISHLEGKVDTSNAAITEALNKKENAGVCLPLTGGKVTGRIRITDKHYIWANTSTDYAALELGGGPTYDEGACLVLRSNKASDENETGSWALVAHREDGSVSSLLGTTNNVWFKGLILERSARINGAVIEGGFYDLYAYETGLQIIIAGVTIKANELSTIFTFPNPFINESYSIAANAYTPHGDVTVTWDMGTTTSIRLNRRAINAAYNFDSYIKCAFIGKWK